VAALPGLLLLPVFAPWNLQTVPTLKTDSENIADDPPAEL
jgi:hypothetical protein